MTISIFDESSEIIAVQRLIGQSQNLVRQGKLSEAESTCREALEKAEQTLGREHLSYGHVLDQLSQVLEAQHRVVEARDALAHAVTILEPQLGSDALHALILRLHHLYR